MCGGKHHTYSPNSGLNVESDIETPPENIREGPPVNTTLTTNYISRGARIDLRLPSAILARLAEVSPTASRIAFARSARTGDLLLPKLFKETPIFAKIA